MDGALVEADRSPQAQPFLLKQNGTVVQVVLKVKVLELLNTANNRGACYTGGKKRGRNTVSVKNRCLIDRPRRRGSAAAQSGEFPPQQCTQIESQHTVSPRHQSPHPLCPPPSPPSREQRTQQVALDGGLGIPSVCLGIEILEELGHVLDLAGNLVERREGKRNPLDHHEVLMS